MVVAVGGGACEFVDLLIATCVVVLLIALLYMLVCLVVFDISLLLGYRWCAICCLFVVGDLRCLFGLIHGCWFIGGFCCFGCMMLQVLVAVCVEMFAYLCCFCVYCVLVWVDGRGLLACLYFLVYACGSF